MTEQAETNDIQAGETRGADRNTSTPFATLRGFVKPRTVVERCEMCSAELGPGHQHLIEPATRKMLCACPACAILFSNHAETKYRSVPRRIRHLGTFKLTDQQWENLLIPIGMAFFFYSTSIGKTVALYPSPAGATESLLDLEAWDAIVAENPVLIELEPDTEALLVNRLKGSNEYFVVPIDECYRLVGLIRTYWHGLSGGQEVWEEIGKFFGELKEKSRPAGAAQHA